MTGQIASRLRQLGVTLPAPVAPAANYGPTARSGNLLFVAGQVPVKDGKTEFVGKLGAGISVAQVTRPLCGGARPAWR